MDKDMSTPAHSEICNLVRGALITGCFDLCQRREVDRHLEEHRACRDWAAEHVLMIHVLAGERGRYRVPDLETSLEAYVAGRLSPDEQIEVETACCHDLEYASRLNQLREQQLYRRFSFLNPGQWAAWANAVATQTCVSLCASLEDFQALYLLKPAIAAAAQSQRSVYQTPDGALVVSLVDRGPVQTRGPHQIELGLRAHQPDWIGRWALYRILDAQGNLGAAGLIKIEEHGSLAQASVPPSPHEPYSVQVQVLELGTLELEKALDKIEAGGDA
jgi:hypothetical protein